MVSVSIGVRKRELGNGCLLMLGARGKGVRSCVYVLGLGMKGIRRLGDQVLGARGEGVGGGCLWVF